MKKIKIVLLTVIFLVSAAGSAIPAQAADIMANVRGRILLQVQANGEAWYVNPVNDLRYYLGRPDDAFALMREFGLGITNQDLAKMPIGLLPLSGADADNDGLTDDFEKSQGTAINNADTDNDGYNDRQEIQNGYSPLSSSRVKSAVDSGLANRLAGRILLQVQNFGEAWYVHPADGRRYFLGRPGDAFTIMRLLGLGIANDNLNKIAVGSDAGQWPPVASAKENAFVKFASVQEFQEYLDQAARINQTLNQQLNIPPIIGRDLGTIALDSAVEAPGAGESAKAEAVNRVSETNVQTSGIDEPDYLKTDGQEIYYSSQAYDYRVMSILPDTYDMSKTRAINGWPADELAIDDTVRKYGRLLLTGDTLIVFTYDEIIGYSAADPKNLTEIWSLQYDDWTSMVDARLYDGRVYVVTQTYLMSEAPCPLRPLSVDGREINLACTDIYHPSRPAPTDMVSTIWQVNPANGQIMNKTALSGGSYDTIMYMSLNNLYLTYHYPNDSINFMLDFLIAQRSYFSATVAAEFDAIKAADSEDWDKQQRLEQVLLDYLDTLTNDEIALLENELMNNYDDFAEQHLRDYEFTEIVKINLTDLAITANGRVPGDLLNQFSLGEENGNLFAATTVGQSSLAGSVNTANDVYVLNSELKQIGALIDLGLTERIYAVRFIGDQGYVVTFRQIDPFYVLDLSEPTKPRLAGELKIPGFSAYLHPLTENIILGAGEDDWRVKISLFNVANPDRPVEVSKYILDDYYSDVLYDHRAFLQDAEHEIFFVPGSESGYIFSYANNQLKLLKVVTGIQARRAMFINEYLYIVGDSGIVVLDEADWEKVNELSFE